MNVHSADIFATVRDSIRPKGLDAVHDSAGASRAPTAQTAAEEEELQEEETEFSREALHCVRYVSVARGVLSKGGAAAAMEAASSAITVAPPILRIVSCRCVISTTSTADYISCESFVAI